MKDARNRNAEARLAAAGMAPPRESGPVPRALRSPPTVAPPRKADKQIGVNIDDLVTTASRVSADAPRPALDPNVRRAREHLAQKRIEVVLKDKD